MRPRCFLCQFARCARIYEACGHFCICASCYLKQGDICPQCQKAGKASLHGVYLVEKDFKESSLQLKKTLKKLKKHHQFTGSFFIPKFECLPLTPYGMGPGKTVGAISIAKRFLVKEEPWGDYTTTME